MKRFIAFIIVVAILIPQSAVFAIHETKTITNERYASYIDEAIEKSRYNENELDLDNTYVVEKTNVTKYKSNDDLLMLYVAIPILGTDDIVYTSFNNDGYKSETKNSAAMIHIENYMNSKIDKYIEDNKLANVTEVVSTIFYGRTGINCYRVVTDNETYFIPYYFERPYNLADDEACALEYGKAYTVNEFIERLEKEEISYNEYREAQKKAEEEKLAAEAKAEEEKYRPTVSLDEKGDEVIRVNGTNLDNVMNSITETIASMKYGSTIKFAINTESDNYITEYRKKGNGTVADVMSFTEALFDEIKTQVTSGKPGNAQNTSSCKINGRIKINVWEDGVSIETGKDNSIDFKIKNPAPLIDIMKHYSIDAFKDFTCEKNDENTPHIREKLEGVTKTDVIEFKFTLPPDTDNDISKEVSSPGKTVTGTFEKYKENKYRSTYILKISGNLGTISFWTQTQSSLDGTQEIFSNNIPVSFSNRLRFEDGNMVEYKAGKESAAYKFKMIFASNDISEVYFEGIECTDLKYSQLTEDTKLSDEFIEKDKEAILREAKECADTLYNFGLFKGTDKGYELEKSLTREESATILVRLLGEEEKVKTDDFEEVFVDVDKDRWSYAYVMYCYKHNITKGTGADTFSPEVQIDANQFITLMMRLLGFTEVNPDTALEKSVEYKLLPEEKIDELTTKKVFTRSDMVQIVYNSLKTQMDDETVFADFLLEKGILTEKEIKQIK